MQAANMAMPENIFTRFLILSWDRLAAGVAACSTNRTFIMILVRVVFITAGGLMQVAGMAVPAKANLRAVFCPVLGWGGNWGTEMM